MPRGPANDRGAVGLALLLGVAGTTHLLRPDAYRGLVPHRLGRPGPWVLGSGLAELACAAAVLTPATRRVGALATAALFVAVLPGNVTMAVRAERSRRPWRWVAWARLPLQVPLVLWALRLARASA